MFILLKSVYCIKKTKKVKFYYIQLYSLFYFKYFLGCCFIEFENAQIAKTIMDKYDGFKNEDGFIYRFNWVNNKKYIGNKYSVRKVHLILIFHFRSLLETLTKK